MSFPYAPIQPTPPRTVVSIRTWLVAAISVICFASAFYYLYIATPRDFPNNAIITIEPKRTLSDVSLILYQKHVIKSPLMFRIAVILRGGEGGVRAGDYFLSNQQNVIGISSKFTRGQFGFSTVKITLPEGITTEQTSAILAANLLNFDAKEFITITKNKEGMLFPDTYNFPQNAKPKEVVMVLESTFAEKVKSIQEKINVFGKPLADVVVMASILEAEARTTESRQIISGILWKRLRNGMALQVDAPFQYFMHKNTFQLTTKDLQADSPYNTYRYKGLPPTAIGNPGLDALTSAVTPTTSPYLFYLSDVRGEMHYARTYDEHLANRAKYLK